MSGHEEARLKTGRALYEWAMRDRKFPELVHGWDSLHEGRKQRWCEAAMQIARPALDASVGQVVELREALMDTEDTLAWIVRTSGWIWGVLEGFHDPLSDDAAALNSHAADQLRIIRAVLSAAGTEAPLPVAEIPESIRKDFLAMTVEMHDPATERCGCGYPKQPCLRIMLRNGPPFPPRPCEPAEGLNPTPAAGTEAEQATASAGVASAVATAPSESQDRGEEEA